MAVSAFIATEVFTFNSGGIILEKTLNFAPLGVVGATKSQTIKKSGLFTAITIASFTSVSTVGQSEPVTYLVQSSLDGLTWYSLTPLKSNGQPMLANNAIFYPQDGLISVPHPRASVQTNFGSEKAGSTTFKVPKVPNTSYRVIAITEVPMTLTTVILGDDA